MRRSTLIFEVILLLSSSAHSQVSVYAAGSYGYTTNPMYNYEEVSDQVKQGYFQAMYGTHMGTSSLLVSYVNGLALFNSFADRNYLEHSVSGLYNMRFGSAGANMTADGAVDAVLDSLATGDADSAIVGSGDPAAGASLDDDSEGMPDSSGVFLTLGLNAGQRLDKAIHAEFDNFGVNQQASVRFSLWKKFVLRVANGVGYRSYVRLPELSNMHDILTARMSYAPVEELQIGIMAGAGMKQFVNPATDTTKFEPVRSYIIKQAGHGKPGGKIKSTKLLLANATTNTTMQYTTGFFTEFHVSECEVTAEVLERLNSKNPSRYLAQTTTASGLNQDIYNDEFSYEGWEAALTLVSPLIADIKATARVELQRKKFGSEAYTLAGDMIAANRKDNRRSLELTLARSLVICAGMDLEVTATAGYLRNESNDEYSDFSCVSTAIGLGIGF